MPNLGYFDTIFAVDGDLSPIPDPAQPSGTLSYQQGFPITYSTPVASGGINVPRVGFNQLFFDVTAALQQYQQNGIPPFITTAMNGGTPFSYTKYAQVLKSGIAYQSLVNGNTDTPPSANWAVLGAISAALANCKLVYTSATTITLNPFNGNTVTFPNGTQQSIGGGLTGVFNNAHIDGVPAQTLSPNTHYYIYLVSGGSPFLDFSVTAYTVDAPSGITIKIGDNTRVLVGQCVTNGAGQFVQSANSVQVRSYFNENSVVTSKNYTAPRSTVSATPVDVNSEIHNNLLTWAGEIVTARISGTANNTTAGDGVGVGIGVDSTSAISGGGSGGNSVTGGAGINIGCSFSTGSLSEGLHFFTLLGFVTPSGTANFGTGDYVQCVTTR